MCAPGRVACRHPGRTERCVLGAFPIKPSSSDLRSYSAALITSPAKRWSEMGSVLPAEACDSMHPSAFLCIPETHYLRHQCALATGCAAPDRPVLCARRMAPRRARSHADRTPLCFDVKGVAARSGGWGLARRAGLHRRGRFPAAGIIGSRAVASRTPCGRRCAAGLRPVLDPAVRSPGLAAARERGRWGS